MASVIFHSFNQIKETGIVKLFKSHKEGFKDGEQLRDFIYVKDVLNVIYWMAHKMIITNWDKSLNGLYNLGTGKAKSFYDLAVNTFIAQGLQPNIEFIDMPFDIRDKYQYFTEANMKKLRAAGYDKEFSSLEEGLNDYVVNYLCKEVYL
jgi:ADP-L-glycero-D-manno-heptose 6-epimerase